MGCGSGPANPDIRTFRDGPGDSPDTRQNCHRFPAAICPTNPPNSVQFERRDRNMESILPWREHRLMTKKSWERATGILAARVAVEAARAEQWFRASCLLALAEMLHATVVAPTDLRHALLGAPLTGAAAFAMRQYLWHRNAEQRTSAAEILVVVNATASETLDEAGRTMIMNAVRTLLGSSRTDVGSSSDLDA